MLLFLVSIRWLVKFESIVLHRPQMSRVFPWQQGVPLGIALLVKKNSSLKEGNRGNNRLLWWAYHTGGRVDKNPSQRWICFLSSSCAGIQVFLRECNIDNRFVPFSDGGSLHGHFDHYNYINKLTSYLISGDGMNTSVIFSEMRVNFENRVSSFNCTHTYSAHPSALELEDLAKTSFWHADRHRTIGFNLQCSQILGY